jgi:hypothetical protein
MENDSSNHERQFSDYRATNLPIPTMPDALGLLKR